MNKLNPVTLNFWLFFGALGYALADGYGCAVGLAFASGFSLVFSAVWG